MTTLPTDNPQPAAKTPVVYHPGHALHSVETGLWVGVEIDTDETPDRIDSILTSLAAGGHEILQAADQDLSILDAIHDHDMLDYMERAHEEWVRAGIDVVANQRIVTAYAFPTVAFMAGLPLRGPTSPGALAGRYAMDTMTRIGPGTFQAALSAVYASLDAATLVAKGRRSAYAATRPPGHHAGSAFFGGSCYLNNAAIAAEALRRAGHETLLIVDIDAHHGNGTQEIFYERRDVVYTSVHVDPAAGWFPHYMGHSDEIGRDEGAYANLNVPLEPGSDDTAWLSGLGRCVDAGMGHSPTALVVSLGVDAAISDTESPLMVTAEGFAAAGELFAQMGMPTVFVQEGGYDLNTLGDLVAHVIDGFDRKVGE